jgi:hypothetical protein
MNNLFQNEGGIFQPNVVQNETTKNIQWLLLMQINSQVIQDKTMKNVEWLPLVGIATY